MPAKTINITNQKFNKLKAIRLSYIKDGIHYWIFKCDCGKECELHKMKVKHGSIRSCGCLKRKRKHGFAGNKEKKEYRVWNSLKQRCNNPKYPMFYMYGAKGIEVSKRWSNSFINFLSDMSNAPSEKHTIIRINKNKNYTKSNCMWSANKDMSSEKPTLFKIDIKSKTLKELSQIHNISYSTLSTRVNSLGWSIERALSTKARKYRKNRN